MIEMFNCDCMDKMAEYKDNHFDIAIVDPPYRDENQFTKDMRRNTRFVEDQKLGKKPTQEYFNELYRVSKEQIIWGANNFQLPPFKGFLVYKKLAISEKFTMSMCEIASLSEGLGTVSKYIELPPQNKFRIHPTEKPVKLYRWQLGLFGKPGDKILDTHGGSFSNAVACHQMGFDLVICEDDEEVFSVAKKRFKEDIAQMSLI